MEPIQEPDMTATGNPGLGTVWKCGQQNSSVDNDFNLCFEDLWFGI